MVFGEPLGGLIPGAWGSVLSVRLRTGAPLSGRQVYGLVSNEHSLRSVQEALKVLARLGIVETQAIGRAGVHTLNEWHAAVVHLRALGDPIATLRAATEGAVGSDVDSVIVFGSMTPGGVWAPALYTFLAMSWGAVGWLTIATIVVAATAGLHPAASAPKYG